MNSMTRQECEEKIAELMKQAVDVLLEYQPNDEVLSMSWYRKTGNILVFNGAFCDYRDIKPVERIVEYRKGGVK